MAFIRINNRKNFLLPEVPKLHPESAAYSKFWRIQKKRCIEGLWSIDDKNKKVALENNIEGELLSYSGGWRFMPGNLYFYVNFGTILHKEENDVLI